MAEQPRGVLRQCPKLFRSFRHTAAKNALFSRLGSRLVVVFPSNTMCSLGTPYTLSAPNWQGIGQYDFSIVDAQFQEVLNGNPDAHLVCMVDLNPPAWWQYAIARNEGEAFWDFGRISSHPRYRKDMSDYLRAFLTHCNERWGERMAGYILGAGVTTEWQDYSNGQESPSREAAWNRWLQERGLLAAGERVDIPPRSVRERASYRNTFRDPQRDAEGLRYWQFVAEANTDVINFFARAARELLPPSVALGIFYGYILEYGGPGLLHFAHLDFDHVFANPDLDFFISPCSYADRGAGGAGGTMYCIDSLKQHGKLPILEIDHRTHTARYEESKIGTLPGADQHLKTEAETISVLQREFSHSLIRGGGYWWFDMFHDWFVGERVHAAIARMEEIFARHFGQHHSGAQIAWLVDPRSAYYLHSESSLVPRCLHDLRQPLGRCGAPFDIYSTADLDKVDFSQYRLVILSDLFVVDEKTRRVLDERVLRDGRHILWLGPAGILRDGKLDEANVAKLTGFDFADWDGPFQILGPKKQGDYFSLQAPNPDVNAAALRQVARGAGVHVYLDSDDPFFANDSLLCLHTAKAGTRSLSLPEGVRQVTDLFRDETFPVTECRAEIPMEAMSTRLLAME